MAGELEAAGWVGDEAGIDDEAQKLTRELGPAMEQFIDEWFTSRGYPDNHAARPLCRINLWSGALAGELFCTCGSRPQLLKALRFIATHIRKTATDAWDMRAQDIADAAKGPKH